MGLRGLVLDSFSFEEVAISPYLEMGAYEALWCRPGTTFRSLAEQFEERGLQPSDIWRYDEGGGLPYEQRKLEALQYSDFVVRRFNEAGIERFGVRVHGAGEYPMKLRDAAHPIEFLYYEGWWDLVNSPSVSVTGARKPSSEGLACTRELVRELVKDDFTIASGLDTGIDRMAHEATMEENGRTFAVLGTPLSHVHPEGHRELQRRIAKDFLVVSQVPVKRYLLSDELGSNAFFFLERRITMSALTEATIVVEADGASDTEVHAGAALAQGRKLFILDRCFRDASLEWPARMVERGAIRVRGYDGIRSHLSVDGFQ